MSSVRRIVVIVNPLAGSGRGRDMLTRFAERAWQAGYDCQMVTPPTSADLPRVVAENAVDGATIALAGGDGTVHNALPGLVGRPNPLLLLPLGTENLLARQLGIRSDLESLWSLVERGQTAAMDLARVNGTLFATVLGAGFDAEVIRRLSGQRRGHITHLDYIAPFWNTFRAYRFPKIRVHADGKLVSDEPAMVFVGNIPRYAIGLRILREARWDDGKLDLCVMPCSNQGQFVEHALRALLNWHLEHQRVIYQQVQRVTLEADVPLPLQCDGDPAGTLPAEVEVLPGAIRILTPGNS